MIVRFSVLGEPQGKGRPRFAKVGGFVKTYTPDQTVVYENLVRTEFRRQCGNATRFDDNDRLDMRIMAYYSIPKSASKKKVAQMISKDLRPAKKPDMDNIVKVVADSLNGVAYKDDAQVVDTMVRKFYSDVPRIEVSIRTAETHKEEM